MERNTWGYHLLAFVIVAIWGSTFVFTKLLLQASLSPAHIFTLRFTIAYLLLLLNPTKFHSDSWKDELLMMALGLTGGSLYFLAENAAMLYTTATNTSLIVCSCPLFAMLLMKLVYRQEESITRLQAIGSMVAFLGMAVVVLNGRFVLHLSPIGDMLALVACICWAFYSLLMKTAMKRYSTLFITRKVFFYGLLTMIPYYIWHPEFPSLDVLLSAPVFWNLLFLSIVASMICYLAWNFVIKHLGIVVATNWVYFNPITTILFAWWLLSEEITVWFLMGSALILIGMYMSDHYAIKKPEG